MTWLETTNPDPRTCVHKWARVFNIRRGGAIEAEWLDPATGAAFAVLSAGTLFSFRVGYGAPGTKDVVDVTSRFGPDDWRFDPRDIAERSWVRDQLRATVWAVLDRAGGVLDVTPERLEHVWTANVVFPPKAPATAP